MSGRLAAIVDPADGVLKQPVAAGAFADACIVKWHELNGTDMRFLKGSGINVPVEIYRQIEGPARQLVEHWARSRGAFKPWSARAVNKRGRGRA